MTDGVGQEICRLFVRENALDTEFLIDTGADISVYPALTGERLHGPAPLQLFAANQSPIKTFGKKTLNLSLGLNRTFRWTFILADVNKPIIGADFLSHYGLIIDVKNSRLIDNVSKSISKAISHVGLLPPSVKSISEESDIYPLLSEFKDITTSYKKNTPIKHNITHHIQTTGPPICSKARRLSPEKLQLVKREFDIMLKQGICRPSKSCWASPLHIVPKPNGEWRLCGDYRRLNSVTIPDRYPVPHIHDFGFLLNGAKVFSKVDLVKAYYQIPVESSDIEKQL